MRKVVVSRIVPYDPLDLLAHACSLLVDLTISKFQIKPAMKRLKKDQVTPERLMQFGFAYAPPLIIGAAASNKVFDSLQSGGKTVEEVSQETGASTRGLRAIMGALVGLELLKKDGRQKYSLTPESATFLLSDKAGTQAGFFATILPQLVSRWLSLT